MQAKTVVITGATSGIGKVAAEELAAKGARIIQVARNPVRAEAALNRLRQIAPHQDHVPDHAVVLADLSVLAEMRRAAEEVARLAPRIDVLMNNAGAIFAQRELTADGMERTFATNHLSYFVLTQLLREPLLAAARETGEARIVSTASTAHARQDLDLDDLQYCRRATPGFPPIAARSCATSCLRGSWPGALKGPGCGPTVIIPAWSQHGSAIRREDGCSRLFGCCCG